MRLARIAGVATAGVLLTVGLAACSSGSESSSPTATSPAPAITRAPVASPSSGAPSAAPEVAPTVILTPLPEYEPRYVKPGQKLAPYFVRLDNGNWKVDFKKDPASFSSRNYADMLWTGMEDRAESERIQTAQVTCRQGLGAQLNAMVDKSTDWEKQAGITDRGIEGFRLFCKAAQGKYGALSVEQSSTPTASPSASESSPAASESASPSSSVALAP